MRIFGNEFFLEMSPETRLGLFLLPLLLLTTYAANQFVASPDPVAMEIDRRAVSIEEIVRGNTFKKQVILTFDGGDENKSGYEILKILAKHNVHGSFFLTGIFIKSNADFVRSVHRGGHDIYNHTFSHPYMTEISDQTIATELRRTENILKMTTGASSKPFFRPPYGARDGRVLRAAFGQGYQSVYWTVDAMDWRESEGWTEEDVKRTVLSNLSPGAIFLLHIGDTLTGKILDDIIVGIEDRGYDIVSLNDGI